MTSRERKLISRIFEALLHERDLHACQRQVVDALTDHFDSIFVSIFDLPACMATTQFQGVNTCRAGFNMNAFARDVFPISANGPIAKIAQTSPQKLIQAYHPTTLIGEKAHYESEAYVDFFYGQHRMQDHLLMGLSQPGHPLRWHLDIHFEDMQTRSRKRNLELLQMLQRPFERAFDNLDWWDKTHLKGFFKPTNGPLPWVAIHWKRILSTSEQAEHILGLRHGPESRNLLLKELIQRSPAVFTQPSNPVIFQGHDRKQYRLRAMLAPKTFPYGTVLIAFVPIQFETSDSERIYQRSLKHGLTSQEARIMILLGQDASNMGIAHQMHLSFHTIRAHLRNIFRKLNVSSRHEALRSVLSMPEDH